MKRINYNPFYTAIAGLVIWLFVMIGIIPTFFEMFGFGGGDFCFFVYGLYLLPVVFLIVFNGTLFFNRLWTRKHILAIIATNLAVVVWLINSYYAFVERDFSELWFFQLLDLINE